MVPQWIIEKKRDGHILTDEEIRFFINGFTAGTIPDYQMAAMAMAIYLKGMTPEETAVLTDAMMRSGAMVDTSAITKPKVDKHSTGGIGDKVSIILAPLAACAGLAVPMISGRGLGITGGTLDKLESIPGFNVNLSEKEFIATIQKCGFSMIGQTGEIAPADKKLYALRDVTGTVASIPLITGSIMCKKMAEGIDSLVLDVKWGAGAFMRTIEDATTLALTAEMLLLGKKAATVEEARAILEKIIASGAAFDKFKEMAALHGADVSALDDLSRLPRASIIHPFPAPTAGYISKVDAESIGRAVLVLGGGRQKTDDRIDYAVGTSGLVKIGESVQAGQPLVTIHANSQEKLAQALTHMEKAFAISAEPVTPPKPIVARITG